MGAHSSMLERCLNPGWVRVRGSPQLPSTLRSRPFPWSFLASTLAKQLLQRTLLIFRGGPTPGSLTGTKRQGSQRFPH